MATWDQVLDSWYWKYNKITVYDLNGCSECVLTAIYFKLLYKFVLNSELKLWVVSVIQKSLKKKETKYILEANSLT